MLNRSLALGLSLLVLVLAGCDSGDIEVKPTTIDNSITQGGGGSGPVNACASYTTGSGQTVQGTFDEATGNCSYSSAFADAGNPVEVDLFIPALDNDGAHIFEGSLFIGFPCDTDQCLADNGIAEGGDGPSLTVEPGATLAWRTSADFMIIQRGSQLFAVGRADAPITFTSVSDVNGTVQPEDVQQWGGIVINGFGITNKCAYTGSLLNSPADLALDGECHVRAEGAAGLDESFYGGINNDDSSGRLEYVVVKHTGATVGNGDELNGISFGGVGRNTIVENLEVYSTFDDGIEMFGGAVNFNNFLAVYVRDDSIDMDEGYMGTITNALVIQAESIGNHCIEADGIGSFSDLTDAEIEAQIAQGINSRVTIENLTCIVSPTPVQGDFDQGAGWRMREGYFGTVTDSYVISSYGDDAGEDNYCLRLDNRTLTAAADGDLAFDNTVFACVQKDKGNEVTPGVTESAWAEANGDNVFYTFASGDLSQDPTAMMDTDLLLLEGTQPIYSIPDSSVVVNDATPDFTATGAGTAQGYVGGISLNNIDWIQQWTFGVLPGQRSQPLWFE